MPAKGLKNTSSAGARLAIRMLQDAAESGEIDPWDIDVITVVDGFLDQLRQRIDMPKRKLTAVGGTFERDLDDSSEAFLAASVLVGLKAEVLEIKSFGHSSFLIRGAGNSVLLNPFKAVLYKPC